MFPVSQGGEPDGHDTRTAAAVEAFVAGVAVDAGGLASPPPVAEVLARRAGGASRELAQARAGAPARSSAPPIAQRVPAQELEPTLAGLADPATWDRTVRDESARVARFGRPVTVVMAELTHLDEVAGLLGRDAADRVVVETARLLVSQGRAIDRIAWLENARFGVLLLETGEGMASGYIDRVRSVADGWLQAAGLTVRLSLGWASPEDGRDVVAAAALARARMEHPERHTIGQP